MITCPFEIKKIAQEDGAVYGGKTQRRNGSIVRVSPSTLTSMVKHGMLRVSTDADGRRYYTVPT